MIHMSETSRQNVPLQEIEYNIYDFLIEMTTVLISHWWFQYLLTGKKEWTITILFKACIKCFLSFSNCTLAAGDLLKIFMLTVYTTLWEGPKICHWSL